MPIERALISVHDKTGIAEFAKRLAALHIEILSTGGTAKLLREQNIKVRDVSDFTGWPEMLGGRVKTLHPKVHGGLLFRRNHPDDQKQAAEHGIAPIDMVVVNLYPFESVAAKSSLTAKELIENIDIGGPTMLRSAAKNFESVTVVTDPADYELVASELESSGTVSTTLSRRLALARKVFATTARYDGVIATEMERLGFDLDGRLDVTEKAVLPEFYALALRQERYLRYGENPHQKAALYIPSGLPASGLAGAQQLQGKELSYNNLVDLDAAWSVAQEFADPACAIVKHNNPCGTAEQKTLAEAYRQALACDPVSAFGGVLAFNRNMDAETAAEVAKLFVECIIAPAYDPAARETLAGKKNLRLMQMGPAPREKRLTLGSQKNLRRSFGSGTRYPHHRGSGSESGYKTATQPRGTAGSVIRLEGREAREVERHCLRAWRPDTGSWSRPNEPRGFSEDCRPQGARVAGRQRGRLRCFFPVSRRSGGGRARRRYVGHPAGRFSTRRGSHCSR